MSEPEHAPGTTLYRCPLCEWSVWSHAEPLSRDDVADALTAPAGTVPRLAAIEAAAGAHLATHPPIEWVRENARLRDGLAATARDLARHERDTVLTIAILVRKLGGRVLVTAGDLLAEDGALVRIPEGGIGEYTLAVTGAREKVPGERA